MVRKTIACALSLVMAVVMFAGCQQKVPEYNAEDTSALLNFVLRDAAGNEYQVAFVGNYVEETVNNADDYSKLEYVRAEKGDSLYKGSFGFRWSKEGETAQTMQFKSRFFTKDFIYFNKKYLEQDVVVVKSVADGMPDLLRVAFANGEPGRYQHLLYIKDGALTEITYEANGSSTLGFMVGAEFVTTGANAYKDVVTVEGVEQFHSTWTLDPSTSIITFGEQIKNSELGGFGN